MTRVCSKSNDSFTTLTFTHIHTPHTLMHNTHTYTRIHAHIHCTHTHTLHTHSYCMQESQEIHGFLPWTQLEDRDKPQSVLWGSEDGALPTGDISMDTSTCVGRERIRTHVRFLSSGEQRWEGRLSILIRLVIAFRDRYNNGVKCWMI